jgi:hypothetical protein
MRDRGRCWGRGLVRPRRGLRRACEQAVEAQADAARGAVESEHKLVWVRQGDSPLPANRLDRQANGVLAPHRLRSVSHPGLPESGLGRPQASSEARTESAVSQVCSQSSSSRRMAMLCRWTRSCHWRPSSAALAVESTKSVKRTVASTRSAAAGSPSRSVTQRRTSSVTSSPTNGLGWIPGIAITRPSGMAAASS